MGSGVGQVLTRSSGWAVAGVRKASGGVQQASGSDVIRFSSATAGIYIRK
jgi:hypothetical protein